QINWVDGDGKRHGASYSVEKWGLRRALWNGCLRLYRERQAAGRPVEEPHEMFARAQEPFIDQIQAEIVAEQEAEAPVQSTTPEQAAAAPPANGRPADGRKAPRPPTPEEELKHEQQALQHIASTLFGKG